MISQEVPANLGEEDKAQTPDCTQGTPKSMTEEEKYYADAGDQHVPMGVIQNGMKIIHHRHHLMIFFQTCPKTRFWALMTVQRNLLHIRVCLRYKNGRWLRVLKSSELPLPLEPKPKQDSKSVHVANLFLHRQIRTLKRRRAPDNDFDISTFRFCKKHCTGVSFAERSN